jgi:hypothetical protein
MTRSRSVRRARDKINTADTAIIRALRRIPCLRASVLKFVPCPPVPPRSIDAYFKFVVKNFTTSGHDSCAAFRFAPPAPACAPMNP